MCFVAAFLSEVLTLRPKPRISSKPLSRVVVAKLSLTTSSRMVSFPVINC